MKKNRIRIIGAASLLLSTVMLLTACKTSTQPITVEQSQMGKEATQVLNMLSDEIQFFDYQVDDSIAMCTVTAWHYQDGKWEPLGQSVHSFDEDTQKKGRIAVRIQDNAYDVYFLTEDGSEWESSEMGLNFSVAKELARCDSQETNILPEDVFTAEQEIPLWVQLGGDETCSTAATDFRDSSCDAGLVVTAVFSESGVPAGSAAAH